MSSTQRMYGESLALLTDLYQLTMAYGYWKQGRAEDEAVFHLFFRKQPFQGGFSVAAGLAPAVELLEQMRFTPSDLEYLASLEGNDGTPLFEADFLATLRDLRITCDLHAMPEGTPVFAQEPLLRVRGPLWQCQLLETPLLNMIGFQTLIATKAARVALAARGQPVIEFGLRRAHGIDGGLSASRAAYIGGCAATSNVLAGKLFGIPVKGTHAHSWIMSFDSELEAFEAYAAAMPNNAIFLVDTYDTLEGVQHAVKVGLAMRERGFELAGIRLDSGDLAWLSAQARRLLDEAGFKRAVIVASNDLDERLVASLKCQGAAIDVWGVGTHLVTGGSQPALGCVYKLAAIRRPGEAWRRTLKLSEQAAKTTNPGILQVRRFFADHEARGDIIYDELIGAREAVAIDPLDPTRRKRFDRARSEDLLQPVLCRGERVAALSDVSEARKRAQAGLASLDDAVKRQDNPHEYPVGLEPELYALKTRMVLEARGHRQEYP